jgi:hypothetical protein
MARIRTRRRQGPAALTINSAPQLRFCASRGAPMSIAVAASGMHRIVRGTLYLNLAG